MYQKRGFTLIELLVVVLIIGILVAVAVPQYQKAVLKARATEGVTLLRSIEKAEQAYFMANGQYTMDLEALDLTLPKFTCLNNYCQFYSAGKEIMWEFNFHNGTSYKMYCTAKPNTAAEKICQSLGSYTHANARAYYVMSESK